VYKAAHAQAEINDDVILGVIEQSSAGVAKRRRTAADVFLMITGREASEHELDDLADERG
jgi:hypothetical protein